MSADRGLSNDFVDRVGFVRVIEIAPGRDDVGHAHLHVYLFSPYLHHEVLRLYWGRTLEALGRTVPLIRVSDVLAAEPSQWRRDQLKSLLVSRRGRRGHQLDEVPWPIVDLRACHDGIEYELAKYLVKDAERLPDDTLALLDPEYYARAYSSLEGMRTVVTSRGFWVKREPTRPCTCPKCGGTSLSRRVEPATFREALVKGKVIAITQFVTAVDVMRALQCSRSTAYEHLRRAAGRRSGNRGMLRVALRTWERYAAQAFDNEVTQPGPAHTTPRTLSSASPIPITRPRRPRKSQ